MYEEIDNSLRGKRFRCLLRVSTMLNDASIDDQRLARHRFAARHGMLHAGGDEELNGISGSKTFNRRDLKRLLATATIKKDYDILMVYDSSRLTRGGASHGSSVRREFLKAGVLILSVMDPVPDGDFKEVTQTIIDTQNNLYSKKLSAFITRGIVSAVLRGDVAHHGCLPVGIDRVYVRADGTRFQRLRYAGNNLRQLLNEENGKLIQSFGKGTGTAYRKQKSEKVILVPGDPKIIAAIREAFNLRYKRKWGYENICLFLTRSGSLPQRGAIWTPTTVKNMLHNPLYLGWDYFLKTAAGLFHKGSADGPVRRDDVKQEELELLDCSSLPVLYRKRAEMLRREQPEMNNIIADSELRKLVEAELDTFFDRFHVKGQRRRKKLRPSHMNIENRNPSSPYFLRSIMKESTYNRHLVGRVLGNGTRYYHLSHSKSFCEKDSPGRRNLPAEPIERVVLDILQHMFARTARVKELVADHVAKVLSEVPADMDRDVLMEELFEVQKRRRQIYASANSKTLAEMKDVLVSMQSREEYLTKELAMRPVENIAEDAKEIEVRVAHSLSNLYSNLGDESYERLRAILRLLIADFTMDLATFEGRLTLHLPEDVLRFGKTDLCDMCAAYSEVNSAVGCTPRPRALKIGVFKLIPPLLSFGKWREGSRYEWVEVVVVEPTADRRRSA